MLTARRPPGAARPRAAARGGGPRGGADRRGARHEREQRVVTAAANADAGVEVRAPLADEDLARVHLLPAETLDTQPLSVGVAAVPAGRSALLVCHLSS